MTFVPQGLSCDVPAGVTLAEAAEQVGIHIHQPCGGQGRCGRCRVVVQAGDVRRRSIQRLTSDDLAGGYALACHTLVEGDCTVFIPPQEEMIVRRLPSERQAAPMITLPLACDWRSRPPIRRFYLEIDPPSLQDNTTDFDRLSRTLSLAHGVAHLRADLPTLRRLAATLREASWKVTATLEMYTWDRPEGPPRLIGLEPGNRAADPIYGAAIDIGTTSNVVYLVNLSNTEVVDTAVDYNGQIACGEDVISRIIYATRPAGLQHLQELVLRTINSLLDQIAQRQGLAHHQIHKVAVAGNPAMIHLFLGLNPEPIRLEPYIPTLSHPFPVKSNELGLHVNPEAGVDCLPGVGSYVGSDITAGVLSSKMFQTEKLTLFIDVGTNGEMVLGNSDWLITCACSAGPAFEGSGVHSGMRASEGAIEEVWIDSRTLEPTCRTIGGAPPLGICGSGIISLLAEMLVTGIMTKGGRLQKTLDTPRVRRGLHGMEYVVAWKEETPGKKEDIVINEVDITNLLRAKAAIYAGFCTLTRSVGVELADVEQVLIGGAFGKYLNVEKAI
ncbi:MAG: DUF4445 domain-containing protein, partial [Chloroflexi bacterium]|nr:DUF4445 domain-containing protein [Chloroflexota bacterium]